MAVKLKSPNLKQTLPWILAICGLAGFLASFILTVEKIRLIENPAYIPSCNLSPLLSCGSVMKTAEASHFGFPNSLLGVAGFAVVASVGVAILAGAKFKRWFWLGLNAGSALGIIFLSWLFYETVYRIGALCPYCMVVWAVTIPIFFYTTMYNVQQGHIKVPAKLKPLADFKMRHHGDLLVLWYLIIAGLILNHFWYYWITLL